MNQLFEQFKTVKTITHVSLASGSVFETLDADTWKEIKTITYKSLKYLYLPFLRSQEGTLIAFGLCDFAAHL